MLLIIYNNSQKKNERIDLPTDLINYLIVTTLALLISDTLAILAASRMFSFFSIISIVSNTIVYIGAPIPSLLWLWYVSVELIYENNLRKAIMRPAIFLTCIFGLLSITSPFTHLLFSVDNGVYSRGDFFYAPTILAFIYLFVSILIVYKKLMIIPKRKAFSIIMFPVAPLSIGVLQLLNVVPPVTWSALSLSILLLYLNTQNNRLGTDYLTGANNRRALDYYLSYRIKNFKINKGFGGLLIDIDNFKQINDSLGHDIGDEALEMSVSILQNSLRNRDFISRYAGDEFVVIVDIDNVDSLKIIIDRINDSLDVFNSAGVKPFKLGMSIGYEIYDPILFPTPNSFIKALDLKMYANKEERKRRESPHFPI